MSLLIAQKTRFLALTDSSCVKSTRRDSGKLWFVVVFSHLPSSRNGQFDMTTSSSKNSFIRDGMLHIVPTLTSDEIGQDAVFDNHIYNLTDCTFNVTAPNNGFLIQGDGTTAGSRVRSIFLALVVMIHNLPSSRNLTTNPITEHAALHQTLLLAPLSTQYRVHVSARS